MNKTDIDYVDYSWNPIAMRCTPIGLGCANCWHLRMANRLAANPVIPSKVQAAYAGKSKPVLIVDRLKEPLHRRKPSRIAVQFMGDLFHPDVTEDMIFKVFAIALQTPQHTYMVLTKRPERMHELLSDGDSEWCLPNVWLGISAENQQRADERIPWLLKTPAAVRFISAEPLLGPINFGLIGTAPKDISGSAYRPVSSYIHQVIVGGESGPNARPMRPQWARDIRDECQDAGVAFFMKQMSKKAKIPDDLMIREYPPSAVLGNKCGKELR